MSRGLGRIERHILVAIEKGSAVDPISGEPGPVLIHSWGMACEVYGGSKGDWDWTPSGAQRKAVTRAMNSIARKFPQYALIGGTGRKSLFLYEPGNQLSAKWAEMTVKQRQHVSLSDAVHALRPSL